MCARVVYNLCSIFATEKHSAAAALLEESETKPPPRASRGKSSRTERGNTISRRSRLYCHITCDASVAAAAAAVFFFIARARRGIVSCSFRSIISSAIAGLGNARAVRRVFLYSRCFFRRRCFPFCLWTPF